MHYNIILRLELEVCQIFHLDYNYNNNNNNNNNSNNNNDDTCKSRGMGRN